VPDGHGFQVVFAAPHADSIRATSYALVDTTADPDTVLFSTGSDLEGRGVGPVGLGLLPVVNTPLVPALDSLRSGWAEGSQTTDTLVVSYSNAFLSPNLRRLGYPNDIRIVFDDAVVDTGLAIPPIEEPTPARFRVLAETDTGLVRLPFAFLDADGDGTMGARFDILNILAPAPGVAPDSQLAWRAQLGNKVLPAARKPGSGDVYLLRVARPLGVRDVFVFGTRGQRVDAALAGGFVEAPYVVPNPYVGSASFEPARFAISGRGERRMEFRAIPQGSAVRIYTVRGELVRTLYHDGSMAGFVPWDLRTKDNLEIAPGLYLFHVETPAGATHVGKFAVLK
jgi:hypothetical protein